RNDTRTGNRSQFTTISGIMAINECFPNRESIQSDLCVDTDVSLAAAPEHRHTRMTASVGNNESNSIEFGCRFGCKANRGKERPTSLGVYWEEEQKRRKERK